MKIQSKIIRINTDDLLKLVIDEKIIAQEKLDKIVKPGLHVAADRINKPRLIKLIDLCDSILKDRNEEDIQEFLSGSWEVVYVPDSVKATDEEGYFNDNADNDDVHSLHDGDVVIVNFKRREVRIR